MTLFNIHVYAFYYFCCCLLYWSYLFLFQVNGQKLLGLNHVEVVGILKDLPRDVRLVCGRRSPGAPPPLHPPHAANPQSFAARVHINLIWFMINEKIYFILFINKF